MSDSAEFVNHPLLKKNLVQRRDYQEKIFASCVGKNAMVVLPTSLGKTIVALMLTLYHLSNDPDTKIIFLAPTKPLVVQHQKSFLDLTVLEEWQLPVMTGSTDPEKRKKIFLDAKVAFMTPQVLQNDVISKRVELKEISLIIFDEAHRATGDYAYTFLADIFLKENPKGQILAMSASPGGDKEKIEEVCKALKVNHIEIRSSQSSDVKPYVHNIDVNWITLEMPDEYMKLKKDLEALLKLIYKKLHENDLLDDYKPDRITRKQILSCSTRVDNEIKREKSDDRLSILFASKKYISNAIRISHMLELLEGQGIEPLHDYFNKNIAEVRSPQASKSLKELFLNDTIREAMQITKNLVDSNFIHPKLIKVSELLMRQFQHTPDSRVLMFASYRDSISSILKYLSDFPLIKAQAFVGQQKKKGVSRGESGTGSGGSSVNGMSQKEQIQMLQDFREGICNTLVATSVAEEGLDIAECDLVIFYDVIPSEIRTIQRRGRTGRKKDGEIYILMTKGTREEAYYWAERRREKEMQKTLKDFKQIAVTESDQRAKDNSSAIDSSQKSTGTLFDYVTAAENKINEETDEVVNASENTEDDSGEYDQTEKNYEFLEVDMKSQEYHSDGENSEEIQQEKFVAAEELGGKSKGLTIIVDNRETQGAVVRHLALGGADIILKNLPVGDYILSDQVGIERKEAMDFNKSIIDGRVFNELHNLSMNFSNPILILEGNPVGVSGISHEAILGAISSIIINMRITVLSTNDAKETAEFILSMAKKCQIQKDSSDKVYKRKTGTLADAQEQVISGIPGINLYRAQELLTAMSTLKNIFNAEEEDLKKVPGIGYKTAEKIKQIAEWDYNQQENNQDKKESIEKK